MLASDKLIEQYLEKLQRIKSGTDTHGRDKECEKDKQARFNRAKKDYAFFVSEFFPHYAEYPCAPFQIAAANDILRNKDISTVEEWARGHAKSTHFDIFIPIWLHLFHNQLDCMLLVGKNEDAAIQLLSDLQGELEGNEMLKHHFGKLVLSGSWAEGNFITKTGAAFFALGKGQSPRGRRNGANRPDYIVCDDIDDDKACRNPERVDEEVKWVLTALIPTMGTNRTRFVMANNRIGNNTILTNLVKLPRFRHRVVNAINAEGKPSWPGKFTMEFLNSRKETLGIIYFNQEYQNTPHTAGKIFKPEYFQWCNRLPLNQYDRIVLAWDVAYSEAATADFNAMVMVGLKGTQKHVLKAFVDRCTMETALRWLFQLHNILPKTVTVEYYMEQQFWTQAVQLAIATVQQEFQGKKWPNLIKIDRPGRGQNKYSRIVQMLPEFQRYEMSFAEQERYNTGMQLLVSQTQGIEPNYKTKDDGPDALEQCNNQLQQTIITGDSIPTLGGFTESKKY
ncbi:hypothetical protein SAMN05421780_101553 [Flexibacter flexilis DSM 6793]|uniref:Terminase-like family protein n=1 Tax=Flexibacter flexilis DSM 6793 TaxID=927664 RepID=A0A1I1DZT1_9BACT|nr:hypothetical protein [Flexibacter flexilis]SFB80445.1 hypothetical protein SAMN05421780_101553 [Flexibacter flexilis DSM 6793]